MRSTWSFAIPGGSALVFFGGSTGWSDMQATVPARSGSALGGLGSEANWSLPQGERRARFGSLGTVSNERKETASRGPT